LALKSIVKRPKNNPNKIPDINAARRPTQGLPVKKDPTAAEKAPVKIIPSKPILITPDLSEKTPPTAASAIGVASLIAAANVLILNI
jgi:hypothetical protein